MKEIETIIPIDLRDSKNIYQKITEKLQYLLRDPEFNEYVNSIRGRFKLPAYGIKRYLRLTDKVSPQEENKNRKKFLNLASLYHTDNELKALKIKVKSRKNKYENAITKLRCTFDLPMRFQNVLAHWFVPYGKIPEVYSHTAPCLVRVFDDNGEKRIFIEVFGDTQKNDLKKSWESGRIDSLKIKHKLEGAQLFRYSNYYADNLLIKGKRSLVKRLDEDLDDTEIRIRKKRIRDFQKKHGYSI